MRSQGARVRRSQVYTERIRHVVPLQVLAGWLIAAAMTSLFALTFAALGLTGADLTTDSIWATVALALGFWAGGLFTGLRVRGAPLLHGILIGLTSLAVWFALNILGVFVPGLLWEALSPGLTAILLLVQMATATAGAWIGHRVALRGGQELRG
jgi:hypothetical protein